MHPLMGVNARLQVVRCACAAGRAFENACACFYVVNLEKRPCIPSAIGAQRCFAPCALRTKLPSSSCTVAVVSLSSACSSCRLPLVRLMHGHVARSCQSLIVPHGVTRAAGQQNHCAHSGPTESLRTQRANSITAHTTRHSSMWTMQRIMSTVGGVGLNG